MQDQVVDSFSISLDGMRDISSKLTEDFEKGLSREGPDVMVKMLITYVHSLPDGTEKGDFLALDLGGSNFRVLLICKIVNSMAVTSHFFKRMEMERSFNSHSFSL